MATDFEKAQKIIAKRRWSGRHGALPESEVAESIMEGIVWGRREGLELAARLIAKEIGKLSNAAGRPKTYKKRGAEISN